MRSIIALSFYFITAIIKMVRPGGARSLIAENVILKYQLFKIRRTRNRSPKLTVFDRLLYGFLAAFISPKRLAKIAITIKPATILKFHRALVKRKYHLLFSSKKPKKPGPKGPSDKLIQLIVEMKTRNPRFGYLRIAMQIYNIFGIEINKDVVRRVLAKYYHPKLGGSGPSWLSFIGNLKNSLWSIDLFCVESIHLKTYWVLLVMDQCTRKIIGFSVYPGTLCGENVCYLFNKVISKQTLPKYLSSDHDPLFKFHQWQANLRILEIQEIKTVPYVPISHPFVERLIGTVRREYLDHTLFWNADDLTEKLNKFKDYYNNHRAHSSLKMQTPTEIANNCNNQVINFNKFKWKSYCNGIFQLPIAA